MFRGSVYTFDSIPDVEIHRTAQFLSLQDLCSFRLSCKRCYKAAPFANVNKDTTTNPVTPTTMALAIDATDMDESVFTNALFLDDAPAISSIMIYGNLRIYSYVELFSQSIKGSDNGNKILLIDRTTIHCTSTLAIDALMNHPRITKLALRRRRVSSVHESFMWPTFHDVRYQLFVPSLLVRSGMFAGHFDSLLRGNGYRRGMWHFISGDATCNFCDVYHLMQKAGTLNYDYWIDMFRRRDRKLLLLEARKT